MTTGHRHRIIHLPAHGTRLHILQTPLIRTADPDRAKRSRLAWHGLTGLTIETDEAP